MKLSEIKIVDANIGFDTVQKYIDFVVSCAFDAEGNYHMYLRDYAEAIALISMYTDYGSDDFDANEVMDFIWTDQWSGIRLDLGYNYTRFHTYVKDEIEHKNTPLRSFDKVIKEIGILVNDVDSIVKNINIEALKNFDYSKLTNAIDAIDNIKEAKAGKPNIKLVKNKE